MKKIILIILMSFMSFLGYSQLTENFEGTAVPDDSGNWELTSGTWKIFDNGVGTLQSWKPIESSLFTYEGVGRSADVSREPLNPGSTTEEWLVTPRKTIRANEQLRFFTRQGLLGDNFTTYEVRVSQNADPLLKSAYVTIKTYTEAELNPTPIPYDQYNEKLISLGTRSGQNLYIAFVKVFTQTETTNGGDRWLIDNVNLVGECFVPAIQLPTVTAHTATLRWTSDAPNFNLQYRLFGTTDEWTTVENVAGTTTQITDLLASTEYEFRVMAICGEGSTSEWSAPYFFETFVLGAICQDPKVVTALPYSDLSDTRIYGNHIAGTTPGTSCGGNGNYLESLDAVYEYVATENGIISITMNPFGETDTGVFVYSSCANIGTTCLAGVGNGNGNIRTIASLNVIAGQSYFIVVSSKEVTFSFAYLLLIQKVSCAAPTGLQGTVTGMNSVNLSWGPATTTSTAWQIALQPQGANIPQDGDGTRIVNTATQSYSFTDLDAGTNYQYWVRAQCTDGLTFSPWAGPFLFTTALCTLNDQCPFTFTLGDTGSNGWQGGRMQVIQNGLVVATIGSTITGGTANVTVPLCNGIPFSVFWSVSGDTPSEVKLTIKNKFGQLLYTLNAGNSSLFNTTLFTQMVDCTTRLCLPPTAGVGVVPAGRQVTVNFTNPGPVGEPVVVHGYAVLANQPAPAPDVTGYATSIPAAHTRIIIDNLIPETVYDLYLRSDCSADGRISEWTRVRTFTTLAVCFKPTSLGAATDLQLTSVKVGWVNPANSGANSWQVYVVETGGDAPNAQSVGRVADVSTGFVIDNLNPATCYDYYVRANCGDLNGLSTWTGPRTFCTKICADDALKCDYTFTFAGAFNGAVMQIRQNGVPVGANVINPGVQTRKFCSGIPFELFWVTGGTDPAIISVTSIKNSFDQVMYTMPIGSETLVGSSLYTSIADCVNPACLPPQSVTGDIRIHGATISWLSSGTPTTSWEYYFQPLNGQATAIQTTSDLTAVLESLEPETVYEFFVRSVCSVNSPSIWTSYQFTTLPLCPEPTGVTVVQQTDGSTRISWTNVENVAVRWEYFVIAAGSTPPAPGEQGTPITTPFFISPEGMEAGFYEFYIRSFCANGESGLLGPVRFFIAVPPPRCLQVGIDSGDVQITTGDVPSGTLDLCDGESTVNLSAVFPASNETTSYAVTSPRYAPPFPFTGGIEFVVDQDDKWAPVFDLPFKFCFYGQVYQSVQVGTNGVVSFKVDYDPYIEGVSNGETCPYNPNGLNLPSAQFPIKNAIFGPYQDTDLNRDNTDDASPEQSINYQVLGDAPCRAFVVNYYKLPQYNCDGEVGLQTSQIVMYENTNIIEVFIEDRTRCESWQDGEGVIGLINETGTRATVPPGRNTNDAWEAHQESWRFTPSGISNVDVKWYQEPSTTPINVGNSPDVTVTVSENTTFRAKVTYKRCGLPDESRESLVQLKVGGLHIDPIDNVVSCDDTYQLPLLPVGHYYTDAAHTTLLPAPYIISESQRVYVYAETAAGIEPFCTAAQDYMVTVGGFHPPTPDGVTACRSYTLPILPAPYNYYTAPNGQGTQYPGAAETVIRTSHLPMYIYAANADCSGQSSFNIEIQTPKVPDFLLPAFVCTGTTYPTLETTSPNGVTGTWSPTTTIVDSGTYTFTPTAGLCAEPKDYVIAVVPTLTPDFNVTEVVLCEGGSVPTLLTTSPNGIVGTWNPAVVSNTTSATYTFKPTPIAGQCFNDVQLPVVVNGNPAFSLKGGCNASNLYEITVTLAGNIAASDVTFTWKDPSGTVVGNTQTIAPKTTGTYTCEVTLTATGCSSTEIWNVDSNACSIQRGISPKGVGPGDGKNDFFDLEGLNVRELEIFNRYGTKVYSMANYTNQWYGQSKKGEELPDGTYYYVIKRDSAETETGWIYINREK